MCFVTCYQWLVSIYPHLMATFTYARHTLSKVQTLLPNFSTFWTEDPKQGGTGVAPTSEFRPLATFCYWSEDFKMYDKYNDLQWHNFIIIIIITTHHELGLFWSHLIVSSKVFQVIFIWSTFQHYFWYLVVYSCYMSLNERGITFIQNFVKISHPVQKKHAHTHTHTHTYTFFLSLSLSLSKKSAQAHLHSFPHTHS